MAPRRRPRRPRLSRMDAATDAMIPFGFSKELVRRTVKGLLKEYGGDEGWAFIEADAYNVLIETILNEQEKCEQEENNREKCAEEGNLLEDNSFQDERAGHHADTVLASAGPSGEVVEHTCSEVAKASSQTADIEDSDCVPPAEGYGKSWKDIGLDQNCSQNEIINVVGNTDGNFRVVDNTPVHSPPPVIPSPPPVNSPPTQRRKPCYGWISNDDEEDDFVKLTPAIRLTPPPTLSGPLENLTGGKNKRIKRKTMWDLRPEDM